MHSIASSSEEAFFVIEISYPILRVFYVFFIVVKGGKKEWLKDCLHRSP